MLANTIPTIAIILHALLSIQVSQLRKLLLVLSTPSVKDDLGKRETASLNLQTLIVEYTLDGLYFGVFLERMSLKIANKMIS